MSALEIALAVAALLAGVGVFLGALAFSWVAVTVVRRGSVLGGGGAELVTEQQLGEMWARGNPELLEMFNAGQKTREQIEEEAGDVESHLTPFADLDPGREHDDDSDRA